MFTKRFLLRLIVLLGLGLLSANCVDEFPTSGFSNETATIEITLLVPPTIDDRCLTLEFFEAFERGFLSEEVGRTQSINWIFEEPELRVVGEPCSYVIQEENLQPGDWNLNLNTVDL